MKFNDICTSKPCAEIFKNINEFSEKLLKDYNDKIEELGFIFEEKDIFDFVWGTINLSAIEISLIDSPIIQRLRNIQQLGFANYVYCNADYSRFAHTIGVIEVAGRIADVITKRLNSQNSIMTKTVRLAAIFHDTGHLFFSHTSEKFFSNNRNFPKNDKITKALTYFNEQISKRSALHEMLSVMIVNSDEVRRLLKLTACKSGKSRAEDEKNVRRYIEYISGLIVGIAIDKDMLPYSTIIKGAIDADRLDYLLRDSATTKVPLAVDIARLINKITVVDFHEYVPSEVWQDTAEENKPYKVMAIQFSAQRLVWQLSMARLVLYQSIYFHHKKLTAEAMFRKVCEKIFPLLPPKKCNLAYIMSLSDQAMGEYFQDVVVPQELRKKKQFIEAKEIMTRIRDRNLYKRVASFSQDVFSLNDPIYETFVIDIIEDHFSNIHKLFIKVLTNEYYTILDTLGKERPDKKPVFMFIEANWQTETGADIPIHVGNGPYKMASDVFKETPAIGEENRQKQYYLVTDQQDRMPVYLALEKVLFTQHKLQINESASTCAKFTLEVLHDEKINLLEKNYYNDCLKLLPNKIFKRFYDERMFSEVVNKFQTFSGTGDSKITSDSLNSYLKQYLDITCTKNDIKLLLDGILRLLRNGTFIDRKLFTQDAAKLMKKILKKKYKKRYMVMLGGLFDSANHLAYNFNDIKETRDFVFASPLTEVLTKINNAESCISFFDDGAYSGRQAVSIFQELMGVPIEERATKETHGKKLSEKEKEKLKASHVILAYICFNTNSKEYIFRELKKLGICNVEIEYVHELLIKVFDSQEDIFKSSRQLSIVKKYLREIGCALLKSSKIEKDGTYSERWNEKRVRDSALGYNDAQQVVVSENNIPTYSLTALWQNGTFNGHEWRGLFQRTEKSNNSANK
jgi:HD superfamily phosphohydrolase